MTTIEHDQEEFAKSEAALCGWYLEWSQIARIAVTQRALLKQMGFVATPKSRDNAEPDDLEPEGAIAPVAPPSAPSPHT